HLLERRAALHLQIHVTRANGSPVPLLARARHDGSRHTRAVQLAPAGRQCVVPGVLISRFVGSRVLVFVVPGRTLGTASAFAGTAIAWLHAQAWTDREDPRLFFPRLFTPSGDSTRWWAGQTLPVRVTHRLGTVLESRLGEEVVDVGLHRRRRDMQPA